VREQRCSLASGRSDNNGTSAQRALNARFADGHLETVLNGVRRVFVRANFDDLGIAYCVLAQFACKAIR